MPKPIGIQDLQNEISQIELHMNKKQNQNQDIETRLQIVCKYYNKNDYSKMAYQSKTFY